MKTLKLSISVLMAMLIIAMVIPAQGQETNKEKMNKERAEMGNKIRAAKIAFITEQVSLTPEEAEKFWPLYNEQEKKRSNLTQDMMERFRGQEEKEELSNEKAEEMMNNRFKQEEALLNLKKEYHIKYSEILPATKILKLYEAENNFKRKLMERMGKGHGERSMEGRGMAPPHQGRHECK